MRPANPSFSEPNQPDRDTLVRTVNAESVGNKRNKKPQPDLSAEMATRGPPPLVTVIPKKKTKQKVYQYMSMTYRRHSRNAAEKSFSERETPGLSMKYVIPIRCGIPLAAHVDSVFMPSYEAGIKTFPDPCCKIDRGELKGCRKKNHV